MKRIFSLVAGAIVTVLILSTTSCGNKKKEHIEQPPQVTSDSIVAKEEATIEMPTVFPDTAYESVDCIKYNIERLAPESDSLISRFDDLYAAAPGVMTFRGGPSRQAAFGGRVTGRPDTITIDWVFSTRSTPPDSLENKWGGGSGWTGQPLYIKWPDSITTDSKEEIIVGSLCHYLYFIDFNSGKASREPINVGNPIKGTVSLDPTLNGNLYVGQGVPDKRPFGHLVVDLNNDTISQFIPEDSKALRRWGAFDSSPIRIDKFLFWPGENGSLYKYICSDGKLVPHSVLRYTRGGAAPGMESSIAVYHNYGYTGDNHGNILCTNLNTMRPVWCFNNNDDTDASILLSEENGRGYIYTGCEVDRRDSAYAYFRKLDALNGNLIWEAAFNSRKTYVGSKSFDGGFYASPLLGIGNCSDLIFTNCVNNLNGSDGDFVAINRHNGEIIYRTRLKHYAWSSPVAFLNEKNEMFIFTADTSGYVYIIDGIDGEIIFSQLVGLNFESSPVVVGNSVVVGSRGNSIFKMSIK